MKLVRRRPLAEEGSGGIPSLYDELERLFDVPWAGHSERALRHPRVDVYEEDESIVVKADLPGARKDDVEVEIEDGVLTLKGSVTQESEKKENQYYYCERMQGSFHRTFSLPAGVDAEKVTADFKDGVLTVSIPKAEAAKRKRIEIGVK